MCYIFLSLQFLEVVLNLWPKSGRIDIVLKKHGKAVVADVNAGTGFWSTHPPVLSDSRGQTGGKAKEIFLEHRTYYCLLIVGDKQAEGDGKKIELPNNPEFSCEAERLLPLSDCC